MPTLTGPKGTYTITIYDSDGDLTSDRNRPAFYFAGTTFRPAVILSLDLSVLEDDWLRN